jgi:hypothetical protein
MKRVLIIIGLLILMFFGILAVLPLLGLNADDGSAKVSETIKLPEPNYQGKASAMSFYGLFR